VRLGEGAAWALSPDGQTALAVAGEISKQRIVLYPIGPGESRALPEPGLRLQNGCWLPDGRRVIFSANEPDRGVRLWVQGIDDQKPRPISPEGYLLVPKSVSQDGKSVITSGPDRRYYFYPIAGGEPMPLQGLEDNEVPYGWTAGNLLLVRRRGVPARVSILDPRSGRRELWKEFLPQDAAGLSGVGQIFATPDRRFYAYSYNRSLADLYVMEELK
jgi:hypothetical protein